ncbi:hypothetical protein GCM10010104_53390 [Streptomyces indiaensis]|uniref:Uncharacterized protein n=1 Tax=Streptomyces indiaensis TaxID=284033 RepID=A0ABN3E7J4_9ACTN
MAAGNASRPLGRLTHRWTVVRCLGASRSNAGGLLPGFPGEAGVRRGAGPFAARRGYTRTAIA